MCMGWWGGGGGGGGGGESIISVIFYMYLFSLLLFLNPTPDLDYFRGLRDTSSIALFSNAEWSQ